MNGEPSSRMAPQSRLVEVCLRASSEFKSKIFSAVLLKSAMLPPASCRMMPSPTVSTSVRNRSSLSRRALTWRPTKARPNSLAMTMASRAATADRGEVHLERPIGVLENDLQGDVEQHHHVRRLPRPQPQFAEKEEDLGAVVAVPDKGTVVCPGLCHRAPIFSQDRRADGRGFGPHGHGQHPDAVSVEQGGPAVRGKGQVAEKQLVSFKVIGDKQHTGQVAVIVHNRQTELH